MPAKTISLSEDAYDALAALRKPGESFSDAVRRLARRRSLTELAGLMDDAAVDALETAIESNRAERRKARRARHRMP